MKAVIDVEGCVGCGVCVETCPEVIEMDEAGNTAGVKVGDVAEVARAACAVEAIMPEE